MRERMCIHQDTMLESNLNVHVSGCRNKGGEYFCNPVHKELCESCPDRVPVPENDKLEETLLDSVYAKTEHRSSELVDDIMATHCLRCESYQTRSGVCSHIACQHFIPIRDLMRNPTIHCVKGEW